MTCAVQAATPADPHGGRAAPHRTQVGRLVSPGSFTHRVTTTPDPNPPSTSRGGDRDGAGAGGGGGRAFAGEVPAGGGDHDGRRGAAAGVHDLPQQALAVLLRRLRRRALFLLQADVGTRGSSDSDLLLPQWRCDGR
ncbi:hypothetical protein GQ55_2G308600 [Panicum hallii var. hallii]|uniref:Uncharacterized protein n=2 Tax=Panicum hallii TaxID=206008 RepID=A0A2T7EU71_9POAL|nr:hypothetical protein PAHAL_2G320000 [Panicum hallii]PAN13197.1 hypothetical protein PAHAL_2G320000 [Panicum hallii]PUZ71374.1 hypothetical protein GQ55_2G308600 [Panicum hallii var. hallii]PUZ71376.1 hypothetical protein GQ55_2G308600 [Panicum hallii var. hallii]